MSEELQKKRWFGLGMENHPTGVALIEFSDGSLQINLETARENMEPLVTSIRIGSLTFALLSEALARAAHDPSVWREMPNIGLSTK